MDTTTLPVQAALLGVALLLLVILVVNRVRRNAAEADYAPRAEQPAPVDKPAKQPKAAKRPQAAKEPKAAKPEKVSRRARKAERPDAVPADAPVQPAAAAELEVAARAELEVAAAVDAVRRELTAYRSQVRLAVAAVASGTSAGDDPQLAVARVAAAIERLDADPMARAVLPTHVQQAAAERAADLQAGLV